MKPFSVETQDVAGETLYLLREPGAGASARLWPAWGNNLLAARLNAPDGRLVDVVLTPPGLDDVRQHPSWWGIPLLFPWPGRIPRGEYTFGGRRYRLGSLDDGG